MKETIYNLDECVSVTLSPQTKIEGMRWKPMKKSFWFEIQKEGIYDENCFVCKKIEEYNIGMKVCGIQVYYKDRVCLKFSDGTKVFKSFDTFSEAKALYEQIKPNIKNKYVL
jgi:hypothetical protein